MRGMGAAAIASLLVACGGAGDPGVVDHGGPVAGAPAAVHCAVGDRVPLAATPAPAGGARYEFVSFSDVVRLAPEPARGTATLGCAAVGRGEVTVTGGGRSVTVPVTVDVTPGAVLGVEMDMSSIVIVAGSEWRLAGRARVRDTITSVKVRYASLDTTIAVVDSTGLVRAVAAGSTTIVAYAAADPSVQGSTAVSVSRGSSLVQSIFVEPSVSIIILGDTVRLRGFVGLAPGAPPETPRDVTFTTADTTIATVTPTGLVRGRRPGIARIIATPVVAPALRFTAFVAVREPTVP